MTTPDGLTAESEALLDWLDHNLVTDIACIHEVSDALPRIEAVAVARHVRDTGCEELREALETLRDWAIVHRARPLTDAEEEEWLSAMDKAAAALAAPAASPEAEWPWPVVPSESIPATVRDVPYEGMTFVDEVEPDYSGIPPACASCGHGGGAHGSPLLTGNTACLACPCPGYQPATASAAATSEEGDGRYTSTIPLRTYSERTGR